MSTAQVLPRPATTRTNTPPRPRFEGLDGLRAIAIISVLVFHLHDEWLPGGFLGVDVFFVISGFLITSLLAGEIASRGHLDLRGFFTRRARRLLPALALCVLASTLVARAVGSDLVVGIGRQVLGAATFSTNWLEIASGQSYFDQTSPILFMNLWSLAVEEQFYLLWPVITFVLLVRVGGRAPVAVPLGVAAASTLAMALLFVPGEDATRVYYGTDTHLMGLMIGATLAFAWAGRWRPTLEVFALRQRAWLGPVALGLLGLSFALLAEDATLTYRGGFTLVAAVTAALLLATITRGLGGPTWLQRLMDARPVTWVGRRSYGLYLWHWPAIVIVDQAVATAPDTPAFLANRAVAVAVTVACAELSFRLVEEPIRRHGFRATGRRVLDAVRSLTLPRARALVASSTLAAALFVSVVVMAPSMSSTAAVLAENAAAASAASPDAPTSDPGAAASESPAAPQSPGEAPPLKQAWTMPTGRDLDGFGDSMMVASVPALKQYFPGIRIDARSNRRWGQGLEIMKARGPNIRRAVVVHLGLNAGTKVSDVEAALDTLGADRMVVIVNLYGNFSRVKSDNAALAKAVVDRPNVAVADWQQAVRDDPRATQPDRLHPSRLGSHLYARAVQRAFAELSERRTGVPVKVETHPLPPR